MTSWFSSTFTILRKVYFLKKRQHHDLIASVFVEMDLRSLGTYHQKGQCNILKNNGIGKYKGVHYTRKSHPRDRMGGLLNITNTNKL